MASQIIEFHYVCASEEFCVRHKFDTWDADQCWSWNTEAALPTFARQLQSWLFFGLISVYLDEDVPHIRLLEKNPNGRLIIDFIGPESRLQAMLDKAASKFSIERHSHIITQSHVRVQQALLKAMTFMDLVVIPYLKTDDHDTDADLWTSEPHSIIFGVDILIDILCEQVRNFQRESSLFYRRNQCRSSLAAEVCAIHESVSRSGRCPSLSRRLRPLSRTWYRILLLEHTGVPQDHVACVDLHCQFNDTNVETYQTRHTESCSGCEYLHADAQAIVAAISNDTIPLVRCFFDAKQDLQFEIIEGNLEYKYTAISHVCAGGLGNPQSNALPSCQVVRLWNIIKELPDVQAMDIEDIGSQKADRIDEKLVRLAESVRRAVRSQCTVYFWLDTLCIPLDPKPRQRAIDSMARIYAGAETVLVLDQSMQRLSNIDPRHHTFMTHLTISAWMARSWPLQEGGVAPNLCVRLQDRTVFLTRSQQKELLSVSLHLTDCLFEGRLRRNPTFGAVWNALASRSTTQRDDLDGIFATLLNLSAEEIIKQDKAGRMLAIIRAQDSIPFMLMCLAHERVDDEVQKVPWVPLLNNKNSAMIRLDDIHGSLLVMDEGFVFAKTGDSGTFGILVNDTVALDRPITIQDARHGLQYEIFLTLPSVDKGKRILRSTYLFILTSALADDGLSHRGCRFEVLSEDHRGMALNFMDSFRWKFSGNVALDFLNGRRLTELDDPAYKVLILENVKDWYKPTWSRLEAFPFTRIIDTEFEKWTDATFPAIGIVLATGALTIIYLMDLDSSYRYAVYALAWSFVRPAYVMVEYSFWRLWLAQCVQQRWAATFHDSQLSRKVLNKKDPMLWFRLWTYTPIFFAACACLGCAWAFPARRATLFWIAWTQSMEPVVALGLVSFIGLKQRMQKEGYTDPLPFRWGVALLIHSTGIVPCLAIVMNDISRGGFTLTDAEFWILERLLLYYIAAAAGCVLWLTGMLVLLYHSYIRRPSSRN